MPEEKDPIIIKKYANRRLYNTASSRYVTLDHLGQMVKEDINFIVQDAKTGEDLTKTILTQVIMEEEAKPGHDLLPIGFLKQIISLYDSSLGQFLPQYLELSLQSFMKNQELVQNYMHHSFNNFFPFSPTLWGIPSPQPISAYEETLKNMQDQIKTLQESLRNIQKK